MAVNRAQPLSIDATCKEAVGDALLNILYDRVSGGGEFGQILYGARPSTLLVSGFLLPRKGIIDGDEVTSPIWISGHGLDFQIAKHGSGTIRLHPQFSLYVRIIPTAEDVKKRDDCRPQLRMKREVSKRLRLAIRDALNAKWETLRNRYSSRRDCPDWKRITDEVQAQIYKENGIPSNLGVVLEMREVAEEIDSNEDSIQNAMLIVTTDKEISLRDEHFDTLEIPHKWFRLDLEIPPLELDFYAQEESRNALIKSHEDVMDSAIQARIGAWLANSDPLTGGKFWAYRTNTKVLPSHYKNWEKFLDDLRAREGNVAKPSLKICWDIQVMPDWIDPSRLNIHVALENRTELLKSDEVESSIFQVNLGLEMPEAIHKRLQLERVEPSYRYNRYLTYAAIGFNGAVQEEWVDKDGIVRLKTTWTPRYHQPRIIPISYPGVIRNMRKLSEPDSLLGLRSLSMAYETWLKQLPGKVHLEKGIEGDAAAIRREEEQFEKDIAKWKLEKTAIETGIEILKESRLYWKQRGLQSDKRAVPFEAWLAMNEAMANFLKLRLKDDSAEWRLFQLAFVLANLPSIVTRMPEYIKYYDANRDDAVTLLYFATGGGKSEAFFGLLLFVLYLDRLRGKVFGVSAMIRYPLRLLTIQQAQRAAKVLAQAELVRKHHKYDGAPFSIGFWVGSGGSPNWHTSKGVSDIPIIGDVSKTEEKLRDDDTKYASAQKAWNKLPSCPFCGTQTGLRRFPNLGGTLAHICTNSQCIWNDTAIEPLPFYICDEDIYDLAPSVLLGTVDKLALIGHSARTIRRVLGMLGTAPWRDKKTGRLRVPNPKELKAGAERYGCTQVFPMYEHGERLFHDPFPALLVQDEAHLLDESLGTFAGLFESALDAMLEQLTPWMHQTTAVDHDGLRRRAKVIAASATVSEPERQLEHLYQRRIPALQFPFPGPDIYRSFYAAPQDPPAGEEKRSALTEDMVELRSQLARIYCGFMTNGRPHTTTTVAILANFHLTITDLFEKLSSDNVLIQESARNQLSQHISPTLIREVLVEKLESATVAELATLVDLHRIALTYVTNKKGGDQIMAAESEEVRKLHKANGYQLDALHTRLITGSVEQGEIQNTVEVAQKRVTPGQLLLPLADALRSIVATSAVSHGVDVEELNSMFFAGMPSDIAEYIQASSRVGRTHVGFCVLIPTPQRRRDRYIVEVFDIFHRFLERMVQPAAIDRWAEKAIQRVIPSLFQACLCGVIAMREFARAGDTQKQSWRPNEEIRDFLSDFQQDRKKFIDQVTDFISLAIGLKDGFAPQGEEYYQDIIRVRVRRLLDSMAEQQNQNSSLRTFFGQFTDTLSKPMTSLRDVDQAGRIRLARKDDRGHRLDAQEVHDVMALIRHGYAESGDEEDG